MTRPIKFRKWIGSEEPRMMPWEEIVSSWYSNILDGAMQYTGLLDSKGKEIYEGDIVKMVLDKIIPKYAICTVAWREKYAGFNFSHVKLINMENPGEGWSLSTHNSWEIIGNKWENPELLK